LFNESPTRRYGRDRSPRSQPKCFTDFYDKSGFEVCNTDVFTTPTRDSENQLVALRGNGSFYCSRANYLQLDRWNVSYSFPKLVATVPNLSTSEVEVAPSQGPLKVPTRPTPEELVSPQSGDDSLTGFDLGSGHLEMKSGKTFLVDREGEKSTAHYWAIWADVNQKQPEIHYDCDARNECLIENLDNKQAIHGRRQH
jgi:hypothetical protein